MGVYVHVPFCARKCFYCDFYSLAISEQQQFESLVIQYLQAVRREALLYQSRLPTKPLSSLFIGGGTPSLVPAEQLAELIRFLLAELPFESNPEITIEVNPSSLTADSAAELKAAGVNRISLGVQAFHNGLLQKIGRTHQVDDIIASVQLLRDSGFTDLNFDLMFGLPGQTESDWTRTLDAAIALKPQHLSCYSLIIEAGTPFAIWLQQGVLEIPTDDLQAEMYELACETLQVNGYEHYEISNFAQPGFRSRHNLLYWRNEEFLGLGPSATGYLNGIRSTNVANLQKYLAHLQKGEPPVANAERVSVAEEMDETMMVGMRLLSGVNETWFKKRYGVSYFEIYEREIEELITRGLVRFRQGALMVTETGLVLENQVSAAFLR